MYLARAGAAWQAFSYSAYLFNSQAYDINAQPSTSTVLQLYIYIFLNSKHEL